MVLPTLVLLVGCSSKKRTSDDVPDAGDPDAGADAGSDGWGSAPGWQMTWAVHAGGELDGDHGDIAWGIAHDEDAVYLVGRTYSENAVFGYGTTEETWVDVSQEGALFVTRYTEDGGVPLWVSTVHAAMYECTDVAVGDEGSLLVSGRIENVPEAPPVFGSGEPAELTLEADCEDCPFVARFSESGEFEWVVVGEGEGLVGLVRGVAPLSGGSSCVVGQFHDGPMTLGGGTASEVEVGQSSDEDDAFVVKIDQDGTPLWARTISGGGHDQGRGISALPDGSCVAVGSYESAAEVQIDESGFESIAVDGSYGHFAVRYDTNGDAMWVKDLGVVGSTDNHTDAVVAAHEDGVVVAGWFQGAVVIGPPESPSQSSGDNEIYVMLLSEDGSRQWTATASGSNPEDGDTVRTVQARTDGSILIGGGITGPWIFGAGEPHETELSTSLGPVGFLALYNAQGTLSWALRAFHNEYNDYTPNHLGVTDLVPVGDDRVFATGWFEGEDQFGTDPSDTTTLTSFGDADLFLFRMDLVGGPN